MFIIPTSFAFVLPYLDTRKRCKNTTYLFLSLPSGLFPITMSCFILMVYFVQKGCKEMWWWLHASYFKTFPFMEYNTKYFCVKAMRHKVIGNILEMRILSLRFWYRSIKLNESTQVRKWLDLIFVKNLYNCFSRFHAFAWSFLHELD